MPDDINSLSADAFNSAWARVGVSDALRTGLRDPQTGRFAPAPTVGASGFPITSASIPPQQSDEDRAYDEMWGRRIAGTAQNVSAKCDPHVLDRVLESWSKP